MVNASSNTTSTREAQKKRTKKRHARIIQMYKDMYHIDRMRLDDVENEVCDFWGISPAYLRKILKKGA